MRYILRNILSIFRDIVRNTPRTLFSSFGIIFLISFIILSLSLKESVRSYLENRIFGKLRINQIKITPINKTKFIDLHILSGSRNEINRKLIKRIRKIKDIESIEKIIRLNYPASIKAGMFGQYLRTDIFISGVDRTFIKESNPEWKDFVTGKTVPILIPVFAMDLYNNFAVANGLPEIGEEALKRLSMEMIIGRSSFRKAGKEEYIYKAKIFGFASNITTAGVVVPSGFIKKFARDHAGASGLGKKPYSCTMLIATVKDIKKIPGVAKKIKRMGLNVESQMDIAEKTKKATAFIDGALTLVVLIILLLTMIAIFNSYLAVIYNRSHVFSLHRVLGASKLRIVFLLIIEAGFVGIVYGVLGYFLGIFLLNQLSENISKWIPLLKGFNLTLEKSNILLLSIAASTVVSSISALIPAVFASNLNLFSAIRK